MPQKDAGSRTEPPVSVPIAQGASRAATATPEPLLEPPGVWCLGPSRAMRVSKSSTTSTGESRRAAKARDSAPAPSRQGLVMSISLLLMAQTPFFQRGRASSHGRLLQNRLSVLRQAQDEEDREWHLPMPRRKDLILSLSKDAR